MSGTGSADNSHSVKPSPNADYEATVRGLLFWILDWNLSHTEGWVPAEVRDRINEFLDQRPAGEVDRIEDAGWGGST
jgi:hypothetical protein